jgi:hypothetical protein
VKKKPQNPNSVQPGENSVTGEHRIQHRRPWPEQGQQQQQEVQKQEGGGGTVKKRDQVSLRLDINLEVEVTVKARIQGDLTLTLL